MTRATTLIISAITLLNGVVPLTATACSVTSPECGLTVFTPPTDFQINLSDPVNPSSVQPSDLTVNKIPADSAVLSNGNTTIDFIFNTSPAPQGLSTMHIPAGAFDCGPPVDFNCTFFVEPVEGCSLLEGFDEVTPPALPLGWTAINGIDPDGIFWQTSDSGNPTPPAFSLPNAAWVNDPDAISDKYLYSPSLTIPPGVTGVVLSFWQNYALEDGSDGGVLEISVDGGPFVDILAAGGFFGQGGYNGTISTCCGNPLGGRQAWTGSSGGFIETSVVGGLPSQGVPFVLRWRMGSDSSGSGEGWRVDNLMITCEEKITPTPTPEITPTPTATATATPIPTPTASPTATPTPTETCRVFTAEYCDSVVFTPPTDFTISVSCPVDPGGVKPSFFTVNNIPANSATVSDLITITFHFNTPPVVPGVNTIHLYPGAVSCCLRSADEFTCTFHYVAPRPSPTPRPRPTPLPRPTPPPY